MSRVHFVLVWLLSAAAVSAGEPPLPRLKQPIDYVAWVNETYGARIEHNAAAKYAEAFDAVVPDESGIDITKVMASRGTLRGDDKELRAIVAWLGRNERSVRLFKEATRVPDCYFNRMSKTGRLTDALEPHLAP